MNGTIISPILWGLFLIIVAIYFLRAFFLKGTAKGKGNSAKIAASKVKILRKRAGIALVASLFVVPAIGIVPAGHRGVIYRLGGGVSGAERGEGLVLLLPWIQQLIPISVRTQKVFSDKVFAQSKDLQEITVVASVNYHIVPESAAELYQNVGLDYKTTVIVPALFQRVKTAVGQVFAESFAANRAALALTIRDELNDQLGQYGIIVEFVNIEDAIFDPAFITAVKNKVIADQVAFEQERLVAAEEHRKQQAIVQAEGRAKSILIEAKAQTEANRLLAASLTGNLLTWRLLGTWDGVLPTTLVTKGGVKFLLSPQQIR